MKIEKRKPKTEPRLHLSLALFHFRFSIFGPISAPLRLGAKALWQYLRDVSGENDYERYRVRARESGEPLLSPQAFYLEKLRRTYTRPNRCC